MLAFLSKVWYSSTYGIQMYIEGVQKNMDNSSELIIVDKKVLPEVFTKVLQVKELLNSGGITSVQEAVDKVGVSRSAYYKYKDHVFTLGESTRGRTAIISINLADEAGILSNVLTINQTIPINNVANVTISIETGELVIGLTKLLNKIAKMQGVMSLKIIARE